MTDHSKFRFPAPVNQTIDESTHAKLMFRIGAQNKSMNDLVALGAGQAGIAYRIDNKKVIKITTDHREANASVRIEGKQLKTISEIYDVFRIPTYYYVSGPAQKTLAPKATEKHKTGTIYGILQEHLEVPDDDWMLFAHLWWFYRTDVQHMMDGMKPNKRAKLMFDYSALKNEASKLFETPITEENLRNFVNWVRMKVAYGQLDQNAIPSPSEGIGWLRQLAKDLKDNGITYRDLHRGNIMKRPNGEHVVVDLGYSRSAAVSIPLVANRQISIMAAWERIRKDG